MATRFRSHVHGNGVHVWLVDQPFMGKAGLVARADWGKTPAHRPLVRALEALVEIGGATATEDGFEIASDVAAAFDVAFADRIGLAPLAPLGLAVALDGRIESPSGSLRLRWTDRSGREVRPERTGIALRWGTQSGRLSLRLFQVAASAEDYNRTIGRPFEARVAGWMPVQQALRAAIGADVRCDGFLDTFTLYQAGSFALDVREDLLDGVDFAPILMSRDKAVSLQDGPPAGGFDRRADMPTADRPEGSDLRDGIADALLSPDDHRAFLEQAARQPGPTRDAYAIGRNRYVLIDPSLKRALDIVKAKRRAPAEERRAFLRNPRAGLAEALEAGAIDAPTATLFIETKSYSDRVFALGLWQRPHLPWLVRRPNAWLPEAGWIVDGESVETLPLDAAELDEVERAIAAAETRGDPHVVIRGVPVPMDAAQQVLDEERRRAAAVDPLIPRVDRGAAVPPAQPNKRLILKTNFEGIDYEVGLQPRLALIGREPPADRMGPTRMKPHQFEGFQWLRAAWLAGWPGVLLADDMGLGKTFQALAFLGWVKSNALAARTAGAGSTAQGPVLVVAPTALLKNWEKECAERLSSLGLGERVDAYGKALGRLKLDPASRGDPGETLDVARLRQADWIMTTYETLTDHDRAFARIHYAVVLFDEMQKIKAPDTLNTNSAKSLNADFVVGLTGTPIENRIEDLWCLFDRLVPGYLGDLKSFSRTYGEDAPAKLTELKRRLDQPEGATPAVMLRRMKADILESLPIKSEKKYPTPMPVEQSRAYRELIVEAQAGGDRSRGFMLSVLHGMRGISLHPLDPAGVDATSASRFEAFVAQSARLSTTVRLLRDIKKRHEKALVFIENPAMQEVVADGLAALFDLDRRPSVINGGTPGEKRLALVEAFEDRAEGFAVLVLSPKAAGIGLNIVAANHVIHLSRWWNPAVEDQCNDRVYRIGQTKPVTIHLPMATHPDYPECSFDETLDRLLESKRQLSRHMLAPPTSEADVKALFNDVVARR